jgi:ubiquinone/menaquinone biosynthesis C-methylase UbiE
VDVICSAEALPFDDGSFDMVFANWMIYHTDYTKAVQEIGRVLVPGGKLFVSYTSGVECGPIYEALIGSFNVLAFACLHLDTLLDGREGIAEAFWGHSKKQNMNGLEHDIQEPEI